MSFAKIQRIKLILSYDGTAFMGWQRQNRGQRTVQGELEAALTRLYALPIKITGSGRTDAGVHALHQVAHFDTPQPHRIKNLRRALNSLLPDDICVKSAFWAPPDFHALASALSKTYIYRIWCAPFRSPLLRNRTLWVPTPLNLMVLNELARPLLGTHDFKSFQVTGSEVSTTVRTLSQADFRLITPPDRSWERGWLLEFRVSGDGFLKQMVRSLVGTLLHLERIQGQPQDLLDILARTDRHAAFKTARPEGLYLFHVKYPSELDNKCRKF